MVRVTHGEVQADHVVLERFARIQRCRSRVIAHPDADPGHAGDTPFGDGKFGGTRHDDMSHAVVAIDERHAGPLLQHAYRRMQVESARTNASRVLRQPNDAVSVRTLQIGFRHQRGDGRRIVVGHSESAQRRADKTTQPVHAYARRCFIHGHERLANLLSMDCCRTMMHQHAGSIGYRFICADSEVTQLRKRTLT